MTRSLLLDTCALLWLGATPEKLSAAAIEAIETAPFLYASPISAWEVALKRRMGKLTMDVTPEEWFATLKADYGLTVIQLDESVMFKAANLPFHHRDPAVDSESAGGDAECAAARRACLKGIKGVDASVEAVTELAELLMKGHAVPDCEATDALHIATSAVYGMDVLLTLNCKHMANPVTLPVTASIIAKSGYRCPIIITPVDFLERKEEFGL